MAVSWVATPALAQEAQHVAAPSYQGPKNMEVALSAVRYEDVATNSPSAIVYVLVRNNTTKSAPLTRDTFAGTALSVGASVYSSTSYTFPSGYDVAGAFENRTLAGGTVVTIAFRFQLSGPVPTAPSTLTIHENPPVKLLGKANIFTLSKSVPGYVGAPAPAPKLGTPPQLELGRDGYQSNRVSDSSFHQLGPLRVRADQIQYGRLPAGGANAEYIEVLATAQNTLAVPVLIHGSTISGIVVSEKGDNTRSDTVKFYKDGVVATSFRLNPGEWMYVTASYGFPNEAALRAARRLAISYSPSDQAGGTFAIDVPPLTKKAETTPTTTKAEPVPGATTSTPATTEAASTAGEGDFRKTAYMDVKLDGVASTNAGIEVTLAVRNRIGRRLGMQHDWQTYTLLGSDGAAYRSDGNHYGSSARDALRTTVWLENDEEAKRTYLFARVPPGVTPTQLIIRDGGKEKARIDLPR
ncbi:hypothetical protein FHS95_002393 [Sphingomonas naasensis]|uniref:Uncharacterized protein n=1 Tax=Sphingomonas naasensis TaxID=1344951 RepID=A0A4S1W8J1_9SPHN|nr:hypothetical protein [Sphingomonas naasensis]NIJ20701.1 hypothetical protein [Sphingomonas naasensis]TGX37577.1 hypothetical protein E5A74_19715 [Sphingomonas naasensis]